MNVKDFDFVKVAELEADVEDMMIAEDIMVNEQMFQAQQQLIDSLENNELFLRTNDDNNDPTLDQQDLTKEPTVEGTFL